MTTNDSEVIIAGCQWIGICQSEETVCPSSISLQTDWQPVSVAYVKLDMLWLPWCIDQAAENREIQLGPRISPTDQIAPK